MYSRDEVAVIVRDAVIETFDLNDPGLVNDENLSFKDDLEADSIDMVSFALVLEDEFSSEIEEDKVEDFVTIKNVINYILDRQTRESV